MTPGTVSFEINDTDCNLRLELDLGGPPHLYSGFLQLVTLAVTGLDGSTPPPVEAPAPVVEDPPEPSPEVPEPVPVSEPVTYSVDVGPYPEPDPDPDPDPDPEPEPERVAVTPGGPMAEVLALLAEAGGELSDPAGGVSGKIADLTGLKPSVVSNTLYRLKADRLVIAVTSARRTTRATLTLSGWEAAGRSAPLSAVADGGADHQQRMRDRAADAVGGTPGSGRRFEARR
jgi:DNA-binding MarR family transcriptional regulator